MRSPADIKVQNLDILVDREKSAGCVKPMSRRTTDVGQRQGAQLGPPGEEQEIVSFWVEIPRPATMIIANIKRLRRIKRSATGEDCITMKY